MNSSYGLTAAICASTPTLVSNTLSAFTSIFYHCSLVVPRARGAGERTRCVCTYCAAACLSLSLLFEFLFDNEEDLEMEKSAVTATFLKITITGV